MVGLGAGVGLLCALGSAYLAHVRVDEVEAELARWAAERARAGV
jgi:hypothetical protein